MKNFISSQCEKLSDNNVNELLIIAFISIIVTYFVPDLMSGFILSGMPEFPSEIEPGQSFYFITRIVSITAIIIFSCCISFYGIYKLFCYTMLQKHKGRKKLILVLATYLYMIFGFTNTYFLLSYVGDASDSLFKYFTYYHISQNEQLKSLMIEKDIHVTDNNTFAGIKTKLWSGVDTKEPLQLWKDDYTSFNDLGNIPITFIFETVKHPQSQVIRYLPDNKIFVYCDCLYFSVITITSVGYGDITPSSGIARLLVCLETILGQLLLALGIASAFSDISDIKKDIHNKPPRSDVHDVICPGNNKRQ